MKFHANNCQYRIINCIYCNKEIQEYYFNTHEKTECTQLIQCPKCKTKMTRGSYFSKHYNQRKHQQCQKDWKCPPIFYEKSFHYYSR